jgi:hypothetical protein
MIRLVRGLGLAGGVAEMMRQLADQRIERCRIKRGRRALLPWLGH